MQSKIDRLSQSSMLTHHPTDCGGEICQLCCMDLFARGVTHFSSSGTSFLLGPTPSPSLQQNVSRRTACTSHVACVGETARTRDTTRKKSDKKRDQCQNFI